MTALNKNKWVYEATANYRIFLLAMLCILITGTYNQVLAASSVRIPAQFRQEMADTIIVAKDGSGDFTSIQKAIEATKAYPLNRWVIFIKNGVYREQVRIPAWNPHVSLVGESREHTIIRFGSYFGQVNKGRNSTFYTSTVSIEATDVICRHLTIENTAGPVGQAIALSVSADRCLIEDCTINGHQDTFFATGAYTHVYLKNCLISGTTDFLFGDATVLLSYCTILCKADSYIVAASTSKEQAFGFVLDHCRLHAVPGVKHVLLGRPWRPYARTVYLNTVMGDFIAPVGWDNWRSKANESTAYYGEYESRTGDAKGETHKESRARWSHQLTQREADEYTPESILGKWIENL